MPSLREITHEQFRDGTTVDGNRIDASLDGLVATFNALHPRHRESLWVQSQIVGGYVGVPASVGTQPPTPWMPMLNGNDPQNLTRVKGAAVDGVNLFPFFPTTDRLYVYEASFSTSKPMLLRALSLMLHTDAAKYLNNFLAGAKAPPGLSNTNPLRDLSLVVQIDHPYDLENRRSTTALLQKVRFSLDTVKANVNAGVPVATMLPLMPTASGFESLEGVFVALRDINAPIPANSRVRIAFVIPQYDVSDYDTSWGDTPWEPQSYSWSATVLEALEFR